ncbi:hypothetical protein NH340_JMT00177 [Sarcoptes scabiei]|nr:hypothetical protein NH340_JMT00177 [Sarcoptes scabiei]
MIEIKDWIEQNKHYSLQNIGIVSVSQRKFVQQKFDLNQSSPNIQIDDDHNDGGENLENRNQIKKSNKLIRYCSSNGLATNRRHKFNQSLRRVGSFGSRLLGQSVLRSKSNSKTDTPIYTHSNGSDRIHLDDDGIAINSLHTSHCFYSDLYRELNETSQSMFDDQFWGDFHPKFLKFSTNRNETLFLTKKCHNKCNESGSICLIQSLTNRLLNQTIQYYNLIESNQIDCEERLRKFSIYLDGQNRSFGPIKNETFEKFSIKFGPTIESFRFVSRSKDFNSLFNNQISASLLPLLYIHSDYYRNLNEFETLITDKAIAKLFILLANCHRNRWKRLRLKLLLNFHEKQNLSFVEELFEKISHLTLLESFQLELYQNSKRFDSNFEIEQTTFKNQELVLSIVERYLASHSKLCDYSLTIDLRLPYNNEINLSSIENHLGSFNRCHSLSLIINHSNTSSIPNGPQSSLRLNFECLASNPNLIQLRIDSALLTNSNIENLSSNLSKRIRKLIIGCDNRLDQCAMNSLAKNLASLESLCLMQASCLNQNARKEGLYFDNNSLMILLDRKHLPKLKSIKLSGCRIDVEEPKIICQFQSWSSIQNRSISKSDKFDDEENDDDNLNQIDRLSLILINNRYRLKTDLRFFLKTNHLERRIDLNFIQSNAKH